MASRIITKKGSGAPLASDLVHGELAVDTVNKRLYTEDAGGSIIEVGTNPSTIDINAGTIDGTVIGGSTAAAGTFTSLTATSANVNGTVTADGLTVDGNATISSFKPTLKLEDTTGAAQDDAEILADASELRFRNSTTNTTRMQIALSTGDVSFYEDTGTTAKFFWDASNERLGLGLTSGAINPASTLHVKAPATAGGIIATFDESGSGSTGRLQIETDGGSGADAIRISAVNRRLELGKAVANGDAAVTIVPATNNVGIGTDNPSSKLHIREDSTSACQIRISNTEGSFDLRADGNSGRLYTDTYIFYNQAATSEYMRIDSSGNVGIGTTSFANKLSVDDEQTTVYSTTLATTGGNPNGTEIASIANSDNTSTNFKYALEAFQVQAGSGQSNAFGRWGLARTGSNTSAWVWQLRTTTDTTNTTELMRLDSSGRVGIGTTNPQAKIHSVADSSYGEAARFANNGDAVSWARADWVNDQASGAGIIYREQSGEFVFRNDNSSGTAMITTIMAGGTTAGVTRFLRNSSSESARIDSSGNLLVGISTSVNGSVNGFEARSSGEIRTSRQTTSTIIHVGFYNPNGLVGRITTNSSTTFYNTSSDERLKENITDAPAGNIDDIKVRSFNWKVDGSHQDYGMVAQELEAVAPYAVSKGETEDDMWSVDYSKLVPMLIKEIQDLKAEVAALKGAN